MKEFLLTVWKGFAIISMFAGLVLVAGIIFFLLGMLLYFFSIGLQAVLGITGSVILLAVLCFIITCYEIGKR